MKKEIYGRLVEITEKLWDEGELIYMRPFEMEDLKDFYRGELDDILKNIDYKHFNYYHDFFTIDDLGHIRSFINYKNHIIKHSEEILDMYYYSDDFNEDLYNKIQEELKNRIY